MSSPLIDVAMSYIKLAGLHNCESESYKAINELFAQFLVNQTPEIREQLHHLLMETIGSSQPLDKIEAILSCDETPLPANTADFKYDQTSTLRRKTRPWSSVEDIRLLAGIHRFGLDNWQLIARFVGNARTRAQCAQRWSRGLDPRISKDQWSHEDENKLISLIETSGNKNWTLIASQLGNRSDVQCRYHFLQLLRDNTFRQRHPNLVQNLPVSGRSHTQTLSSPIHSAPPNLPPKRPPLSQTPPPIPGPFVSFPPSNSDNSIMSNSPTISYPQTPSSLQGSISPISNPFQNSSHIPLPPRIPLKERHSSFNAHEFRPPIFSGNEFSDLDFGLNDFNNDSLSTSNNFEWDLNFFSQEPDPSNKINDSLFW